MAENVLKRMLLLCVAAFLLGLLLPHLLPDNLLIAASEMINGLFASYSAGEGVVWQSFGSVFSSFIVWLMALWCCGWLPVCFPGILVVILRTILFGFSLMLLCRIDYGYGLLTGILLLLPGELIMLGSLLLLCIPAQNLSASLKKHEPCFSLRQYLALGAFCLLPAAFGSWLKTSIGPWVLDLVLGWI